ncbi:hypothetical protein M514_10423 [Trichuris suis]|uniref:Uncharacterized protein n=1 Tax=Trichuris suis TaxID=68888 RepID=A0A085LUR6_9BILA|nr:hypothetical protein M513_10423 [Trichuris suis]KFD69303.1 hypothetical protein M514_10423 [Trichuris suis]
MIIICSSGAPQQLSISWRVRDSALHTDCQWKFCADSEQLENFVHLCHHHHYGTGTEPTTNGVSRSVGQKPYRYASKSSWSLKKTTSNGFSHNTGLRLLHGGQVRLEYHAGSKKSYKQKNHYGRHRWQTANCE